MAGGAVALALGASCRTLPRVVRTMTPLAPPAVEALVPAPLVRIGVLTDAPRASLAADSGLDLNCGPKPGAGFADYVKHGRDLCNVFEAHRKPIANRFVKRGRIGVAENVLAENS